MKAWAEKRGKTWRVRYERPDGSFGSLSGFATKTAADGKVREIKTDSDRGTFRDQHDALTLAEWVGSWTETHHVSDTTWAKYSAHLRNHILPQFGEIPLPEIQRRQIKQWLNRLRKYLAPATIIDIVTLLSMVMAEAVEEDLLDKTPCRKLGLGHGTSRNGTTATPEQINRIAARCRPHDATLILTAAYTGMRWSELAGLRWRNVDLDHARLTIDANNGALHEIAGRLELGPPKTPSSARIIDLPPFLVGLLRDHRKRQHHEHVFTAPDDTLLRRSNFRRRVWIPAVAGSTHHGSPPILSGLTFHGLRHTHRTWLTEDRVHEVLIFNRLGWHLDGVRGIYDHVTPVMINHLLDRLEQRWNNSQPAAIR